MAEVKDAYQLTPAAQAAAAELARATRALKVVAADRKRLQDECLRVNTLLDQACDAEEAAEVALKKARKEFDEAVC